MSFKSLLFDSFIKGVGKTSAALVVCGVLGGIWTVFSSLNYSFKKLKNNENDQNENDQNENDKNSENIETEFNFDNTQVEIDSDYKFKNIFDNL